MDKPDLILHLEAFRLLAQCSQGQTRERCLKLVEYYKWKAKNVLVLKRQSKDRHRKSELKTARLASSGTF